MNESEKTASDYIRLYQQGLKENSSLRPDLSDPDEAALVLAELIKASLQPFLKKNVIVRLNYTSFMTLAWNKFEQPKVAIGFFKQLISLLIKWLPESVVNNKTKTAFLEALDTVLSLRTFTPLVQELGQQNQAGTFSLNERFVKQSPLFRSLEATLSLLFKKSLLLYEGDDAVPLKDFAFNAAAEELAKYRIDDKPTLFHFHKNENGVYLPDDDARPTKQAVL